MFANNTQAYQRAAIARASAMAAEAAQAALLGKTLSALTQVYAKMQSGQEVNWRDIQSIVESAGYSAQQAEKMMRNAGFFKFSDSSFFGGYDDALAKYAGQSMQKLFTDIMKGGAVKALSDMGESFGKNLRILIQLTLAKC